MMRKWIILIVIMIIAYLAYNYIYQDHRDIQNEDAEYTVMASDMSNEFEVNPSASEAKYLNKTIIVSGEVSEVNGNQITLNNIVFCQFTDNTQQQVKTQENITVKGRFIGFDNLLEEIKLDQCKIIN